MQRPKPTRVQLRVGEDRLHEHEQEEHHCQGKDGPSHAADDRGDEHQDRYQVQYEEAPQTVRLYAFAAQDPEAREEELDRNGENEQPGKYDERPSRYIHPISLRKSCPAVCAA